MLFKDPFLSPRQVILRQPADLFKKQGPMVIVEVEAGDVLGRVPQADMDIPIYDSMPTASGNGWIARAGGADLFNIEFVHVYAICAYVS